MIKVILHPSSFILCWAIAAASAMAQPYPVRPIRIVVPFPPGGASDVTARMLADKFASSWGANVVVDNRTGASGIIGTDIVAKETADGGAGSARLGAWMRPGSGL